MNDLEKYYNKFNEDKRLLSRHGQVEFFVATTKINEIVGAREGLDIIDIGAGTGRYSAYYAERGHNVVAVEPVKKNLSQIAPKNEKIKAVLGNALNLKFADNSFDIALLFGPLYHLFSFEDKLKAISEAKRVLRPGGFLFIMYLMNEYAVLAYAFKEGKLQESLKNGKLSKDFQVVSSEKDLYSYVRLEEINNLMKESKMKRIKIIGVDGATDYMRDVINKLSKEDFESYKQYQLILCEKHELLGASSHVMDVLKKC
ncbi:MAG: class I SAM-dependent methyltransferase [Clostridia bacterium]|nr:class I SAM-dependent methyltransferase [Clostridia bacterium]